jgi:predicted permease
MNRQWRAFIVRLRHVAFPGAGERDLADEMESHLQMQIDDNVRSGMSVGEARRQALVRFGGTESVKEHYRDRQGIPALEDVVADVRYGFRTMRRSPGFTATAVLSLAIGIGATAALFSVVDAVVLRSLPVPRADEIRTVRRSSHLGPITRFSYPMFERFRSAYPTQGGLAAMSRVARMRMQLDGQGEPANALAQLVSGEFFSTLHLRPALGRLLGSGDAGQPHAVISHAFWQRRYAGTPNVIGRTLTLNLAHVTIVGVSPQGFSGVWLESPVDVWVPVTMQPDVRYVQNYSASDSDPDKSWLGQNGIRWLELIVRAERLDGAEAAALSGVLRQSVLAEAETVSDPRERALLLRQRLVLEPFERGSSNLRQQFAAPLVALLAMVSLLLLIACANTANLLLARAAARQREMAVRLSIGASRARVIQQLVTESLLLGAIAGAAGLAMTPWASELLVRMTMGITDGPTPFSVGIDERVLLFTIAVSILTSLLFGLAPAWRTTDLKVAVALKGSGGRGVHDGSRLNMAKLLVVAQVALSLLLVVAAALFGQSFTNLLQVNLGFDQHQIVSIRFNPRLGDYPTDRMPAVYRRLIQRVEELPGVRSATVASCSLVSGCRSRSDGIAIAGYQAQVGEQVVLQENRIGPRYFSTVGMRLLEGRDFDERDSRASRRVAVVNESMVRRYFAGRPAVGQLFGYDKPTIEIVGIVRDARVNASREAPVPMAFYPLEQDRVYAETLDVRVDGDPAAAAEAIRRAVLDVEPGLPILRVITVADQARLLLSQERLVAALTSVLGVLALGLACLGLYGLMSYAVTRRTAELGIRMALGAPQFRLLWMVFRESLVLVSLGIVIGVPLVMAASQLMSAMLFGIRADDPATMVAAALTLVGVAALAAYVPAWRASRVDPLVALRAD